jgi:thymidylate synthase ThyX
MYEAKMLKHSVSPAAVELITLEVNWPHSVHKDGMTHRWARNFESFRARPTEILLANLEAGEYFRPEEFNGRVKGMGRGEAIREQAMANAIWDQHVADCIAKAKQMLTLKIAKEQINFLLQDLCFIRGIITTTPPQLENFFGLRLAVDEHGDPLARKEVYKIATLMREAYRASIPQRLEEGEWHLPLVTAEELEDNKVLIDGEWVTNWEYWRDVSVGRCARVSYLTHDGKHDPEADIALHDRLLTNGHMSPFEHQGTPLWFFGGDQRCGSFGHGWIQYRKLIPGEHNFNDLVDRSTPHT